MSANRNLNSTPTTKSEEAARTHLGKMTSTAAIAPHTNTFFHRTFKRQRPQPGQESLQWHQEDENKKPTATGTAASSSSSSNPPHPHNFYASSFAPKPHQNPTSRSILDPVLQKHIQEDKKKASAVARIAAHDDRFERARGFDEEDDEEFIPNVGKEGEDNGKGKERR
jgi:hypothetical protein